MFNKKHTYFHSLVKKCTSPCCSSFTTDLQLCYLFYKTYHMFSDNSNFLFIVMLSENQNGRHLEVALDNPSLSITTEW